MSDIRRSIEHLALWGLLAAIASSSVAAQDPDIRGSVEGLPLAVADTPLLTLGSSEERSVEEFFRVRSPFLLPSDLLVVPLAGHQEIRVFDLGGEHVTTFGRPGEGPGEFRGLSSAWPRADTIEAFDRRLQRITRIFPDGSFETVILDVSVHRPTSGIPGPLGDGWALTAVTDAGYGRRDEVSVFWFSPDGEFVRVVARTEGFERYASEVMTGATPLSPRAQFASGGSTLYVGETLSPAIRMVRLDGSVPGEITWVPSRHEEPVDAHRGVVRTAIDEATPEDRRNLTRHLDAAPEPRWVPVFAAFKVDDLGFIWVRPYELPRDAAALGGPLSDHRSAPGGLWRLFTPLGDEVGSISLPAGLEPYHITADHIVGIWRDEYDVEHVSVHGLIRR